MVSGALLRHSTATVSAPVGLPFLLPVVSGGDHCELPKQIGDHLPLKATRRPALNPHTTATTGRYEPAVGTAWPVPTGRAVCSPLVAVGTVRRRDVRGRARPGRAGRDGGAGRPGGTGRPGGVNPPARRSP
ncbi:hypothetical protein [Kitasatospora phosalacinea]|uniref:hypothetical protein n=1 Tax=Kitasatospora phosalacinea TaxID=2065 RepID=UPI000A8A0FFE|nr:hypothetical protein [Kitasatospora phosalacinea]